MSCAAMAPSPPPPSLRGLRFSRWHRWLLWHKAKNHSKQLAMHAPNGCGLAPDTHKASELLPGCLGTHSSPLKRQVLHLSCLFLTLSPFLAVGMFILCIHMIYVYARG